MPERSSIRNPHAAALGRLGGLKGGPARAAALTRDERSEIARRAAETRWAKARGQPPPSPEVGATSTLAEDRWLALVEAIPAVVYIDALDENATTVYISPQIEAVLGYPMQEWKSDSSLWFHTLHPDDRDATFERYMRERASSDRWTMEYRMIAIDGRTVWVREEDQVLRDDTGQPQAVQGVMYDVTQQKEDEERLRDLDAMKEALLRAVAHDLRGPLSAVLGASMLMTNDELTLDHTDRQQLLRGVASSAKRMDRILANLLDIDRSERGILSAKTHPTDLAGLARDLIADLVLPPGRELVTNFDHVTVAADAGLVERIMENLVMNAIKHTPKRSTVWFKVMEGPPADAGAIIEVSDDGPGVPEGLREELFEPFRRAADPGVQGAGIGLSLVQRFARLQGGRAWVDERPGGGARFQVWLPGGTR